ncbi:hypothetical protein F0562_030501 [Nyssa sinensis]|uniref:Uncharacterized protein n=1 Tax=Nyssa sinensis TaxID=561372 RepID=A0A5J5AZ04_9ASTE|nr:hypothetical protein F0562_030501 [Nyssa sinensis]
MPETPPSRPNSVVESADDRLAMHEVKIFLEDLQQETKLVGKEGDQAISIISEANEGERETVSREQWLESILSNTRERRTELQSQQGPESRFIFRVPDKTRLRHDYENIKSYYEPNVVSIGPYHHGKHNLRQMEDLKLTTARIFLRGIESDSKMTHQVRLDKFAEQITVVREMYEKDSTEHINEEEFIRMMFLDGCFIIIFIRCFISFGFEELGMKKDTITLVQRDIFMLENQLPFLVLRALCTTKLFNQSDLLWMLDRFICYCTIGSNRNFHTRIEQEAKPLHLLDLLRKRWVGKHNSSPPESFSFFSQKRIMTSRLVRNIKELKTTGIFLKPNSSYQFSDIRFSYFLTGRLTLPPMIITDSTKIIFLNVIAHEACMNLDFGFSSYIRFLDSLIDNAEDVRLMRSRGIVKNFLDSDDQVASLFNEVGASLQMEPKIDACLHVKMDIGKYLGSRKRIRMAKWLAQVKHDYFRSPWTIIAVLVGFLAIVLTIVQTYFAIFPRSTSAMN